MSYRFRTDIENRRFDLLIIGGGINGAAIARDAALRGLDVALVERDDLASATTSWSTRLIHGGLRYLEQREFGLVRESVRERDLLLRNAPHLVRPLQMAMPVYAGGKRRLSTIRAGLALYDLTSRSNELPRHFVLSPAAATNAIPALATDGLKGVACFFDAQCSFPERLTVELAKTAKANGAEILNHSEIKKITHEFGGGFSVLLTDSLNQDRITLHTRTIVNAAGPWVDNVARTTGENNATPLIGGTRGSHLVLPSFAGGPGAAIYFEAGKDHRPIFLTPWSGGYLLGTTDVRFDGDPGQVRVEPWEVDYLMTALAFRLPRTGLGIADVRYAYAGVRPLPYSKKRTTAAITRKHLVRHHTPGMAGFFSVIGGKLTTHRSLAEETVDDVCHFLSKNADCTTASLSFPGAGELPAPANDRAARLQEIYGSASDQIMNSAIASELDNSADHLVVAETLHCIRNEFACTLTDLLMRRMMFTWKPVEQPGFIETVVDTATQELGWSAVETARQRAGYTAARSRLRPPV